MTTAATDRTSTGRTPRGRTSTGGPAPDATASAGATTAKRRSISLGTAARIFLRYPTPWMMLAVWVPAVVARIALGGWTSTDAVLVAVMLAAQPFVEWLIHVNILHWRPREVAGRTIDPLLARKHREHHLDPRAVELIFIPWQALVWTFVGVLAIAFLVFPRVELGLTYLAFQTTIGLVYEWTHYLIHSDYRPKSRVYRAVWRHHRLHHYKNERYWMGVTSDLADRVLGTAPDPATVETSPTVRTLGISSDVG